MVMNSHSGFDGCLKIFNGTTSQITFRISSPSLKALVPSSAHHFLLKLPYVFNLKLFTFSLEFSFSSFFNRTLSSLIGIERLNLTECLSHHSTWEYARKFSFLLRPSGGFFFLDSFCFFRPWISKLMWTNDDKNSLSFNARVNSRFVSRFGSPL